MDDIALAFDPTGFLSGIKAVENQLVSLNDNFKKTGDTGERKNQKVQLSAMNLMGVFAKLGAVVGVFKFALLGIPEIGQTFRIAGDIFQRNLLWPLRKELMPILQSVLDWVRDNRAMFVRWGTVIANVFRTVFGIIKQVIAMAKQLFNTLSNALEGIFGKTTKTVTEMANLILFKITAVAQFILMAIEPILKHIIKGFVMVIGYVKSFIEGFMIGFGSIMPVLEQFKGLWDRIVVLFDKLLPVQSKLNVGFKSLGAILGTVVLGVLLAIVSALDLVITGVEKAINRLSYFQAWRKGNQFEMKKLDRENKAINDSFKRRTLERADLIKESVLRTKDVLVGAKGQVTNTNTSSSNVVNDNKVVHINVNGAKDPKATANEIKTSLSGNLREARYRAGGR